MSRTPKWIAFVWLTPSWEHCRYVINDEVIELLFEQDTDQLSYVKKELWHKIEEVLEGFYPRFSAWNLDERISEVVSSLQLKPGNVWERNKRFVRMVIYYEKMNDMLS